MQRRVGQARCVQRKTRRRCQRTALERSLCSRDSENTLGGHIHRIVLSQTPNCHRKVPFRQRSRCAARASFTERTSGDHIARGRKACPHHINLWSLHTRGGAEGPFLSPRALRAFRVGPQGPGFRWLSAAKVSPAFRPEMAPEHGLAGLRSSFSSPSTLALATNSCPVLVFLLSCWPARHWPSARSA